MVVVAGGRAEEAFWDVDGAEGGESEGGGGGGGVDGVGWEWREGEGWERGGGGVKLGANGGVRRRIG